MTAQQPTPRQRMADYAQLVHNKMTYLCSLFTQPQDFTEADGRWLEDHMERLDSHYKNLRFAYGDWFHDWKEKPCLDSSSVDSVPPSKNSPPQQDT